MADKKPKSKQETTIKVLEERINTIGRAVLGNENFGKVMNTAVTTRTRVQRGFNDQMAKRLHFYNMPSQDDVIRLSEQCARIEERVVRIENAILQLVGQSGQPSGPPRTRRPKKAKSAETAPQPKRTKTAKKE